MTISNSPAPCGAEQDHSPADDDPAAVNSAAAPDPAGSAATAPAPDTPVGRDTVSGADAITAAAATAAGSGTRADTDTASGTATEPHAGADQVPLTKPQPEQGPSTSAPAEETRPQQGRSIPAPAPSAAPAPQAAVEGSGERAEAGTAAAPAGPRRTRTARVLWLTGTLGLHGDARALVNCARHRDRSRYTVEIAHLLPAAPAIAEALQKAGVPTHRLAASPDRHGTDPLWPLRLRALLTEGRYDLVHTHGPLPAVAARLLARKELAVPLVHTEHHPWSRHGLPARWANAATYGRNAAVVTASAAVARSISQSAVRRVVRRGGPAEGLLRVVHFGPDLGGVPTGPEARDAARTALGLPRGVVAVGAVGGLTAGHDQRTLLDAFGLMLRHQPETVLVLVGTGPEEERLRRHAEALGLGLGHQAVFAGERTDAVALLPALDVFALTPRRAGLPLALLEAMACGLPCVATRVGGVPEVVDEGVEGLLVQPGDVEALAVALGRLVGGAALRSRMAAAARERARRFPASRAQRAVEAVYEQVLANSAPAVPAGERPPSGG